MLIVNVFFVIVRFLHFKKSLGNFLSYLFSSAGVQSVTRTEWKLAEDPRLDSPPIRGLFSYVVDPSGELHQL